LALCIGTDPKAFSHFAVRIRRHENRSFGAAPKNEAKILLLPDYTLIFTITVGNPPIFNGARL
jgi:hypothetical protein